MVIDSSAAMVADTGWKPIAGPPVRTSRVTPVSLPEESIRVPDTIFLATSTE
jgi:hypothetical protein